MKRIFLVFSSLILGLPVFASPGFTYINNGGITTAFNSGTVTGAVPVDAFNFFNSGNFTNVFTSEFPYDMSNVRNITNRGFISGSVGFKFDTVDTALGARRPLSKFLNDNGGDISAVDNGASFFGFSTGNGTFTGSSVGTASFLKISATNLINRGNLSVGTVGLMQLTGQTVDLSRGSITAGQASNGDTNFFLNNFFSGNVNRGFFIGNSYVNAFGVEDIYWGAGPDTFNLPNLAGQLFPPFVVSPQHAVQLRSTANGATFGLIQTLPQTFPADFEAFCNINQIGTNKEIQVVFVKTNFTDTNISANVRFGFTGFVANNPAPAPFGAIARSALVEFSTPEFDPISGQIITNAIYFIDSSAEQSSIVLLTNALSANSLARPSGYEIATATPFEWINGQPANDFYDPSLIFPGDLYKDKLTVAGFYGGYSAQVGRNPEVLSGVGFNTNFLFNFGFDDTLLSLPDPTNQAGRIEINADRLNLSKARIRTEGLLTLNAKHLDGVGAADVSAGIISADLGSTNGSMTISNVFPSHFKRVRGELFAWSGIWSNTETNQFETNAVRFHVLILDHDLKADFKPTIRDLTLRSTNLVVKDDLTVVRSLRFFSKNLTFAGTNTLAEDAVNMTAANLVGLKNFVNESNSVFQGADNAYFGFDTDGLDSFINRGMISATAPAIKATIFQNSGTITAPEGNIIIQADAANLSNGTLTPDHDLDIFAEDLVVTNSIITAGGIDLIGNRLFGHLVLNVTDSITDFGAGASNVWQVSDGFNLPVKPFEGDLLGTEIRTIASGNQESQHIWAGEDRGPGPDGYLDNVALGHLILDIQSSNSTLRFTGADIENALYVVNLDFNVGPNVDVNSSLNDLMIIDDNMTIYYINSNAGDKLTNAFPGRVIQVEDFGLDNGQLAELSVTADGLGIVSPNLDGKKLKIGSSYQMKAKPGAGQVFQGWTGGTNASDTSLTFKMKRNLAVTAHFGPNPLDPYAGSYNGLFHDMTNGVSHETAGFLNLKLRKKGAFTGKILLGKPYSFNGTFPASGSTNISVRRSGKSSLLLNLQLGMTNNTDQLLGTVTIDGQVATLVANRAGAGSVVQEGKYTLAIPGGVSPAPAGDGIGTVDVDANGGLRLKGTLADGTRVNQSVSLSKNGEWPLYLPIYQGNGSVWSQITFTNNILLGDVNWFKKPASRGNYSAGFTNVSAVIGSHYSAMSPVLGITDGAVTLSGGNLTNSITNGVTLGSNNVVAVTTGTNGLNIKISLPTGLLNGNFVHPDTKKKTTIKGIVLQQQNSARGFFLGTEQSGAVILEGN